MPPVTGKLSDLSKMTEAAPLLPMRPAECEKILAKLKTYSKQELIELLDYWDREVAPFHKKKEFMFDLRNRLQELKHPVRYEVPPISADTISVAVPIPTSKSDKQTKLDERIEELEAHVKIKELEEKLGIRELELKPEKESKKEIENDSHTGSCKTASTTATKVSHCDSSGNTS